jgi:7,8-didemethyl-8-hydroxy-5-deazariboflavin synthase CofH subunit
MTAMLKGSVTMLKTMNPDWREIPWERALAAASASVANALEKSLAGKDLGFEEGMTLATVEGNDLVALAKVADELRRRAVGDRITYVVNRNLNFTNVCIVGCAFCGFSRGADSPDAYFHSTDTLLAKSLEAVERGATEVCIQGGLPKDLDGYYYVELLRAIKARLPELHVHAYSPMEITYGVEKTRLPLRDYLLMLKEAGLNSIPGTAAEILDDNVRRSLSPNKLKVRQWIEVVRTAHSLGIPSTSTMMYGHTESPEHWVRHLLLLREIQRETGGFTEFVPLGFIHSQTKLFQIGGARAGHSIHEDLIVHALARVLLHGYIPNIQVSWVKLGFDQSLACLEAGANDFGGTLMEESISKAAGANFGEYVSPGEFRALIRTIGRVPAERATTYKIRKVFEHSDAEERLPLQPMPIFGPATDHAPVTSTGY